MIHEIRRLFALVLVANEADVLHDKADADDDEDVVVVAVVVVRST